MKKSAQLKIQSGWYSILDVIAIFVLLFVLVGGEIFRFVVCIALIALIAFFNIQGTQASAEARRLENKEVLDELVKKRMEEGKRYE